MLRIFFFSKIWLNIWVLQKQISRDEMKQLHPEKNGSLFVVMEKKNVTFEPAKTSFTRSFYILVLSICFYLWNVFVVFVSIYWIRKNLTYFGIVWKQMCVGIYRLVFVIILGYRWLKRGRIKRLRTFCKYVWALNSLKYSHFFFIHFSFSQIIWVELKVFQQEQNKSYSEQYWRSIEIIY